MEVCFLTDNFTVLIQVFLYGQMICYLLKTANLKLISYTKMYQNQCIMLSRSILLSTENRKLKTIMHHAIPNQFCNAQQWWRSWDLILWVSVSSRFRLGLVSQGLGLETTLSRSQDLKEEKNEKRGMKKALSWR